MPVKNNPKFYNNSLLLIVYDKCQQFHREKKTITIAALATEIFNEHEKKSRNNYYRVRCAMKSLENSEIISKKLVPSKYNNMNYEFYFSENSISKLQQAAHVI